VTPFEFVTVFFSVVIGLGVAHLLTGVADLVEVRDRVRLDWIHSSWLVVLFFFLMQSWWGLWALHGLTAWSYPSFILVVVMLGTLYLISSLALPRIGEDVIDLRRHFEVVRPTFMVLLTINVSLAAVLNGLLFDTPFLSVFTAISIASAVLGLLAAIISNRAFQGAVVIAFALLSFAFAALDTTVLQ
jgi:hypothetical protein